MLASPDPTDGTRRRHGDRIVYPWPLVAVGTFDCWPDDPRWRAENCVGADHVIAFPGRSVEIAQDGDRARVMDPTRFVFYNRYQTYRRRLLSRDGDHCTFLAIAPALLEEIARDGLTGLGDVERRPFPRSTAASAPAEYLEMHAIVSLAASDPERRQLEIEERLVGLVGRAVRRLLDAPPPRRRVGARTRRARAELVEAARAVLGLDLDRPLSLGQVAARLDVSVFHLSRVFREATGMGLHAYRDQLRLRRWLPSVLDGSVRLTDLALEAGYASSSHFTDRFRAVYGVAPSRLRI